MKRPDTDKPICLDLYCGAGGCSEGYSRAGFYVIGVDIKEQPNYVHLDEPDNGVFIQGNALEFPIPDWVDFVHASPECQRFSSCANIGTYSIDDYGDDIAPVRAKLEATGRPYVIENVPGAPLRNPIVLHGEMFGLNTLIRKRLFESNIMLFAPPQKVGKTFTNASSGYSSHANGATHISVAGHNYNWSDGQNAMGIHWMKTKKELALSIPPAYTEFIGRQVMDYLKRTRSKAA